MEKKLLISKLFIVGILTILFLTLGCTSTQDNNKQQYFSYLEKYFLDNHNYFAEYEAVDNSLPNKEIIWFNSGIQNSFSPITKISDMNVFFLSDKTKFNIKMDFNLLTNLTNESHTIESIPLQFFSLSDYNKSFTCTKERCVEQKLNNLLTLPTKEQVMAELKDTNLRIEILQKSAELPSDATCFQVVESKLIQCFLADGVLAYMGTETMYIKLKNIQRDVVTVDNFTIPYIPSEVTADKPLIPKEPSFNCKSQSGTFQVTKLEFHTFKEWNDQLDWNGFIITIKNTSGKKIVSGQGEFEGDLIGGFAFEELRNNATTYTAFIKISRKSMPYPKGTMTINYNDDPNILLPTPNSYGVSDVLPNNASAIIVCSGKIDNTN